MPALMECHDDSCNESCNDEDDADKDHRGSDKDDSGNDHHDSNC